MLNPIVLFGSFYKYLVINKMHITHGFQPADYKIFPTFPPTNRQ